MKLSKLALIAAFACGTFASTVFADQLTDLQLVTCESDCDFGEPICGCERECDEDACDAACDSAGCGLDLINGRIRHRICDMLSIGDCCLGEPWQLFGNYRRISIGGWGQLGYQSGPQGFGGPPTAVRPSAARNLGFNDYPEHVQLQQSWLFAEKAIDASCGLDIGGRVDFIYGTDAQYLQATGNFDEDFDNDWDNGFFYGSALPQLYMAVGYGDVSVKMGRMLLNFGYESAMAPNNFFSGVGLELTERLGVQYNVVGGRLLNNSVEPGAFKGAIHSIVAAYDIRCDLQYVMEATLADYEAGNDPRDYGPTAGISNYFIKKMNDCNSVGLRYEWLGQEFEGTKFNSHELTLGWNHRRSANLIIRPEVRWDWFTEGSGPSQDHASFAMDAIMTF